ncbi:acyl-CoA/acyl-ACP dehydrogenase [Frankia sp. AgB1.9]|uniref:acyl-CoA dehydrogenase family protein n=1 Tax=unclassified Frankia TaxID=2632575 RepID=UPI0019344427|nr:MULTISPECIES: acyl-CoA dehydrogenase family protein [unclassified Frankia]MBL7492801.1 acyl-CoA/acyl-ACP dehydrogenase [Frankia sp. AgW1.1]MBL7549030.1 acyl-CoA/acyl-ACP dehydrogenase [Frankia sp. AgB1.9]MBL7619991.1 acyl-CoA/acyl-ACP dehydrogenase [Frankia sp. AgB1.8]
MLLELTPDQEVFREATARFLADRVPPEEIRRLRDDPAGFTPDYWRAGAELGWTSPLVAEEHGGGSISGAGLTDLTVLAHEFGACAAPGPLAAANVVMSALSGALPRDGSGGDAHRAVLESLLSGDSFATCALGEPGLTLGVPDQVRVQVRADGGDVVLDGLARPVESAAQADYILVTAKVAGSETGFAQVLVPTATPGVTVAPLRTVDLTRRFSVVTFDGVRLPADAVVGSLGDAAEQIERQFQVAAILACAESVGAMQTSFDTTVRWAFERYSFGRPLASYQELKHRFADMKMWLEASHAICDKAAAAVDAAPEAAELVTAAKAYIGECSTDLLQDCVQIHGGIGVTFEHDLHFYLRRVTVNRTLFGTPATHRARLAGIFEHLKEQA